MDLIQAIDLLEQTSHRLGPDADLDFEPTADAELEAVGRFVPLSDELRSAYRRGAPGGSFPALYQHSVLHKVDELEGGLVGYRVDAISGEVVPAWDPAWLVIGADSGDAFIAHTDLPHTPVSIAVAGAGVWEPLPVAPSLGAFYALVAAWSSLLVEEFDGSMTDPDRDFEVKDGFGHRLHSRLSALLPAENVNAVRRYLGV